MVDALGRAALVLMALAQAGGEAAKKVAEDTGPTAWERFTEDPVKFLIPYAIQIVAALAILIIGWIVAKIVRAIVRKLLRARDLDETLVSFISSLGYALLMVFVIIAAIGQLGVQTTSAVAIVGAAGLAVAFALQGSLANFAAGVLVIIFRPFKAGDYIEGGGVSGVVEEVQIFTTRMKTPDNKAVIVPNSKIMGDNIINYSAKDVRRVDLVIGVSYEADLDKTRAAIKEVLDADDRVLDDPAPNIAVVELADSSVNFVVRPWCKTADYWDTYFGVTENVKKKLDAEGISIPFPQRDVHLYKESQE